ncbi:YceI family protein [Leisingera sp. ANG59]|uniref:YceI family protein n=1 Tax=Leisingera sp. ANG59 TaxID=2675221 RepID=UPI0015721827|nr:YceI family protein [Leisingera sp. ANG59]NSY36899.1 hypothetical protein [Leisingera sp. ANG59]
MRSCLFAAVIAASASAAAAAPEKYLLDPSHSQVVFSYNHLGYSTTTSMFAGFEGEIMFDQEDPAASSVSVTIPLASMMTGWEPRHKDLMSENFFNASGGETITFQSTSIEVTGGTTANITGDLTINGVTKPVVLDAKLNQVGEHPMANKPWAGFDATATLLRSDFGVGAAVPFVGDEVSIRISIEAMKADG